jgi:hypothetical protein
MFIYIYLYKKNYENHSLGRQVSEALLESTNDKIMEDFDEIQSASK